MFNKPHFTIIKTGDKIPFPCFAPMINQTDIDMPSTNTVPIELLHKDDLTTKTYKNSNYINFTSTTALSTEVIRDNSNRDDEDVVK